MKKLLFLLGIIIPVGALVGGYLIIDHKINPPPAPVVVEQQINILEEIRKLRINPYSDVINASYHNTEGCDDIPTYKYFARTCLTQDGTAEVLARYDFSEVQQSDIRKDGDTVVVKIGAPVITVALAEGNVRDLYADFGFWNGDADIARYRHNSRISLERTLREAACSRGIIRKAGIELNKGLPAFIQTASNGRVKLRFETVDIGC